MKKLTKLEKFGLLGAVIIACTFLYVKKVYEPEEKKFKQTVASLNKVVGEINGLKHVPHVNQIRGELEDARKKLAELNEKLQGSLVQTGSQQEVTRLLRRISEQIESSGLRIESLIPEGLTKDLILDMSWTQHQVSLSGPFYGFLYLLHSLQDMPDAIRIKDVHLKKEKDGLMVSFKLLI